MDLTIDTWVLYKAADNETHAVLFLMQVLHQKHYVNFDYEENIKSEYNGCLLDSIAHKRPGVELLNKWFVEIVSKSARKHSGILPKNHNVELVKLKFDKSDLKFIAVCHRGNSKILVAEESDYNQIIKDYLLQKMGIKVKSVNDAISVCSAQL